MSTARETAPRQTYRHGDLRDALLAAGLAMATEGGPDAIVLREATRRAGVSPNAAYRHFADRQELLVAVSAAAQGRAADAMEASYASVTPSDDPVLDARNGLRAVGAGYLRFAQEEPGLFRTAFSVPDDLKNSAAPEKAGSAGRTPFQLVGVAIDGLVEVGYLPPDRRPAAEFLAWSAVHGLGMLIIDGPLRGLTPEMIAGASSKLLDMVDRGL